MTTLTIATPRAGYYQQTSVVGNLFSLKMLASGGQTPYYWSFTGPAFAIVGGTTATNYALPFNGWLSCAATTAGADTFTVLVTDNNGATATQSVTITHTTTGITFYPLDLTGSPVLNLPTAYAGTSYLYQLKVAGGTGTSRVFSIASGALPNGLSLSSTGVIQGVPTASGSIASCQVKCIDSGNNTQTVSLYLNIQSQNKVARPAYNTGTAFFVDGNGLLRDPLGYLFTMRGLDRVHYDSDTWAGPTNGGLAYPNAVRVFMFDGQTAAFAANQVQTQYAPNDIFTILTLSGIGGVGTTGDTNPATITNAVNLWNGYFSGLSPVMDSIAINIANEWGPANSTVWRDTYITAVASLRSTGYTCPIVIDTGSSGEDIYDILNYSVAINNSDPLKSCIFSIHPYAAALPWEALIQGVTKGNPTVLTLNSNWSLFPLNPGASTAGNNNYNFEYQIALAAGLPSLNGVFPSDNKTYGSQNNWQVYLSVDSTAWSGNYIANSAHIYLANSTSSRNIDYRYMCSLLAGLQSSGVCTIVGEFGPGNQSGVVTGATNALNYQDTTPGQFISACESYGIGYLSWAWDDHSGTNTLFTPNYFNMVYAVGPGYGHYASTSDLTAFGLDIVGNPRYGTWARAEPAASFLPIPINLVYESNFTYLGSFSAPNGFSAGGALGLGPVDDNGKKTLYISQYNTSGVEGAGAIEIPADGSLYNGSGNATATTSAVINGVTMTPSAQINAYINANTTQNLSAGNGLRISTFYYDAPNNRVVIGYVWYYASTQTDNQCTFNCISLDPTLSTTISPVFDLQVGTSLMNGTSIDGSQYSGGWGPIATQWQSVLGGTTLGTQGMLAVNGVRASYGPPINAFTPTNLSKGTALPTKLITCYGNPGSSYKTQWIGAGTADAFTAIEWTYGRNSANGLVFGEGGQSVFNTIPSNPYWSLASGELMACAFAPAGYRSIVVVGTHGTGPTIYGTAQGATPTNSGQVKSTATFTATVTSGSSTLTGITNLVGSISGNRVCALDANGFYVALSGFDTSGGFTQPGTYTAGAATLTLSGSFSASSFPNGTFNFCTSLGDVYAYCPPEPSLKGPSSYPYQFQLWLYDINTALSGTAYGGPNQPYQIQPYSVAQIPYPANVATGNAPNQGYDYGYGCFDASANRLYLVIGATTNNNPMIGVWQFA